MLFRSDTVIAPTPARPYREEVGADPGRLRIGVLAHHPAGIPVHGECRTAVEHAAALLERLGHRVEYAYPPALDDTSFGRNFAALWSTNMTLNRKRTGDLLGRPLRQDEVEPINWALAEMGAAASGEAYATALAGIAAFRRSMQS